MSSADYLLSDSASELERLRLQARVWEPETEAWLDQFGPMTGWRCLDLGCGAMGILGPLAQRVGPSGHVMGVDVDPMQLRGARAFVADNKLANVEIIEADAYASSLPDNSFDLAHVRFLFAPVGRDAQLMNELWRVTKPGGTIAIQEPDAAAWGCYPPSDAWDRLKTVIGEVFRRGGGDINAGRRTHAMLQERGAEDVRVRAAIVALAPSHPLSAPAYSVRDVAEKPNLGRRANEQVRTGRSNRRMRAGGFEHPNYWDYVCGYASARTQASVTVTAGAADGRSL